MIPADHVGASRLLRECSPDREHTHRNARVVICSVVDRVSIHGRPHAVVILADAINSRGCVTAAWQADVHVWCIWSRCNQRSGDFAIQIHVGEFLLGRASRTLLPLERRTLRTFQNWK
jgi:hypothetical protein